MLRLLRQVALFVLFHLRPVLMWPLRKLIAFGLPTYLVLLGLVLIGKLDLDRSIFRTGPVLLLGAAVVVWKYDVLLARLAPDDAELWLPQ